MVLVQSTSLDRELVRAAYSIREAVFVEEFGFDRDERYGMVTNEFDALSTHILAVESREPVGCAAIADLTGLDEQLAEYEVEVDG